MGKNPEEYGVQLVPLPEITFAKNDISFIDPACVDHDSLGLGLKKAIYNFMHGVGLEEDVRTWFESYGKKIPKTTISESYIGNALR